MKERHLRRSVHIHQMSAWENDDWKKQNYRLDLQSLTESCFLVEKSRRGWGGGGGGGGGDSLPHSKPASPAETRIISLSVCPAALCGTVLLTRKTISRDTQTCGCRRLASPPADGAALCSRQRLATWVTSMTTPGFHCAHALH